MHDDQAAVFHKAGDVAQARDRVGLVDQDKSADDRIEAFCRGEAIDGAFVEVTLVKPPAFARSRATVQHVRVDVNPDDRARRANQLRGKETDVACPAAEIQHVHPLGDSRLAKNAFRRRPQEASPV